MSLYTSYLYTTIYPNSTRSGTHIDHHSILSELTGQTKFYTTSISRSTRVLISLKRILMRGALIYYHRLTTAYERV